MITVLAALAGTAVILALVSVQDLVQENLDLTYQLEIADKQYDKLNLTNAQLRHRTSTAFHEGFQMGAESTTAALVGGHPAITPQAAFASWIESSQELFR